MNGTIAPKELAALFGGNEDEVLEWCGSALTAADLSYRRLTALERDLVVLNLLKGMDAAAFPRSGENRRNDWELGWSENLAIFKSSGFNLCSLVPKYIKSNHHIRLRGDWALPNDPHFSLTYLCLFRAWLVNKYLAGYPVVCEFGCGPGGHLAYMAQALPGTRLIGFDWAESSIQIIAEMRQAFGWPVEGQRFNFFCPDQDKDIERGSAVLTFGALEQVGCQFIPFIDWLLRQKPSICVHVEGIEELYDASYLFDWLALSYHRKRGYLTGFLPYLRKLELQGRIVIDVVHRHHLGCGHDDTYSTIVWRPTP